MTDDKQKYEEDFENFLMIMDEQLEALKDDAEKHKIPLDFSLSDLSNLEDLFDLMAPSNNKEDQSGMVVLFARHLGEMVRLNYGGQWFLPLDDKKNVNFNKPVIIGHSPVKGLEFSPIFVMRAYSLRRKKGALARAVKANVDPTPVDIDHLLEK